MNPNPPFIQTPDMVPLGFISGGATKAEFEAFANQMADKIVSEQERNDAADVMTQGLKLLHDRHHKEALACFRRGLKVFKRLVNRGHAEFACDLAEAHYDTGEGFFHNAKYEGCVASNDAAIRLWQELVNAGQSEYEIHIAYALSTNADALYRLNRFKESLTVVEESIRQVSSVVRGRHGQSGVQGGRAHHTRPANVEDEIGSSGGKLLHIKTVE